MNNFILIHFVLIVLCFITLILDLSKLNKISLFLTFFTGILISLCMFIDKESIGGVLFLLSSIIWFNNFIESLKD